MFISQYGSVSRWLPALLATFGLVVWAVNSHASPQSDAQQAVNYKQAVASPIRTDDDRGADAKRKPLEFLQFTDVRPGMRVLDIAAGAGYTRNCLRWPLEKTALSGHKGPDHRRHLSSDCPVIRKLTSFRLYGLSRTRYPMTQPGWI